MVRMTRDKVCHNPDAQVKKTPFYSRYKLLEFDIRKNSTV